MDGREIRLSPDGTWEFISEDRIANTPDGHRVRLKKDKTWEYIGNAPLKTEQQIRTQKSDIKLTKTEIERYEEKVHKSKRIITQTVFYLTIDISPLAKNNVKLAVNDPSAIIVRDDNGKSYPVLQVTPSRAALRPGSKTQLIIRTEGSPSWILAVKSIELILPKGIVSEAPAITLIERFDNIQTISVDSLPKK